MIFSNLNKMTLVHICFFFVLIIGNNPVLPCELPIDLSIKNFTHIKFSHITPTKYRNTDLNLEMNVEKSASLLIAAFAKERIVSKITFIWKSNGNINLSKSSDEMEKDGDDALIRIGVIVDNGEEIDLPLFAPQWIKDLKNKFHINANSFIYAIGHSKQKSGTEWENPFNHYVTQIAAKDDNLSDGWIRSNIKIKKVNAAGLLIMADGDNTSSSFQTVLKEVCLDE